MLKFKKMHQMGVIYFPLVVFEVNTDRKVLEKRHLDTSGASEADREIATFTVRVCEVTFAACCLVSPSVIFFSLSTLSACLYPLIFLTFCYIIILNYNVFNWDFM